MKKIICALAISACVLSPLAVFANCDDDGGNTNTNSGQPNVVYSSAVVISEILPNPSTDESSDEFIELYNKSSEAVDLTDWLLSDATSKTYTLSGSISAKHYLAFYRSDTNLALNNSGDTVELYHPDGVLTDSIEYTDSVPDDVSYALADNDKWSWTTTPTPFRANSITSDTSDTNNGDSDNDENNDDSSTEQNTNDDSDQTDSPTYQLSEYIQLSELLPDPSGSDSTDEWIELSNASSTTVDLYGWAVTASDDSYMIKESTEIAGNGYVILPITQTSLSLNNSGETVTLVDPAGELMDSVTFTDAPTGESYSRSGSDWQWTTTITAGEANVITNPETEDTDTTTNTNTDSTVDDAPSTTTPEETEDTSTDAVMSISDAKALDSGAEVTVQGVVSVIPGTYSTTYFYMQDDSAGIQIYSSSKAFPTLAIGDVIQVKAKTSTSNGEERLTLETIDDMIIISQSATLTPITVTEATVDNYGRLVTIQGTITSVSGSTVLLDTNWEVYIKRGTEISTSTLKVDSAVTIIGVMVGTDDGVQVWPRASSDISTTTTSGSTNSGTITAAGDNDTTANDLSSDTTVETYTFGHNQPAAQNWLGYWPWLAVGLAFSLLLALRAAWLNTRLRNWCVARVRAVVERFDHSVALEKSTTDSNGPNQYRESHLSGKTPA